MEQELRRRGLTCTLRRFTLEFGQPFRSVEDALAFFRLYSRDGTAPARQELEDFLQCRVNLQCWVKVKEDWRNEERMLRNFGFTEER